MTPFFDYLDDPENFLVVPALVVAAVLVSFLWEYFSKQANEKKYQAWLFEIYFGQTPDRTDLSQLNLVQHRICDLNRKCLSSGIGEKDFNAALNELDRPVIALRDAIKAAEWFFGYKVIGNNPFLQIYLSSKGQRDFDRLSGVTLLPR